MPFPHTQQTGPASPDRKVDDFPILYHYSSHPCSCHVMVIRKCSTSSSSLSPIFSSSSQSTESDIIRALGFPSHVIPGYIYIYKYIHLYIHMYVSQYHYQYQYTITTSICHKVPRYSTREDPRPRPKPEVQAQGCK